MSIVSTRAAEDLIIVVEILQQEKEIAADAEDVEFDVNEIKNSTFAKLQNFAKLVEDRKKANS